MNNDQIKYKIIFSFISQLGVSTGFAQNADSDYEAFLRATCRGLDPEPIFCASAFPGAGGGGAGASSTISNLGVLGSQGRAANVNAYEQNKGIRRRLDGLENKTMEQGGGASSDFSFGSLGTFLTYQHAAADRQATALENGYLSDLNGILGGADYRFIDNLIAGLSVGFSNTNADFNNRAGGLDTDNINVTAYGLYTPTEHIVLDGYFGYASLNYKSNRQVNFGNIKDAAKGTTSGDQYLAGLSASYSWQSAALTLSPQLKLDYNNTYIQGFTESGSQLNSTYGNQTIKSLRTSLGASSSYALSVPWGVLLPQAHAFYIHEFKDDSRNIAISLSSIPIAGLSNPTDRPDRDFFTWGGGVSTVMAHGIQMFVDYEQLSGNFLYNIWTVSAGLRAEF